MAYLKKEKIFWAGMSNNLKKLTKTIKIIFQISFLL